MPTSRQARRDSQQFLRLEQRYQQLKARVAQLAGQRYLTPAEALEVSNLKRQKLAAKDALARR